MKDRAPPIVVRFHHSRAQPRRVYRIAGQRIVADGRIDDLVAFAVPAAGVDAFARPFATGKAASAARRFDGAVWLGGRHQRLTCRTTDDRCWLETDDAEVVVDLTSSTIDRLAGDPLDLIVGPGLALLFAARGIYCLHASAVRVGDAVRVFLGDSGVGKSTLVRVHQDGIARLADDILPVFAGDAAGLRGIYARADYPQLKLAPDQQQVGAEPLPIASIAVLEPDAPLADDPVETDLVSIGMATLQLAHHTVAAKLFPPPLLAAHLEACASWASLVPVSKVRFRRDLDQLDALRRALFRAPR